MKQNNIYNFYLIQSENKMGGYVAEFVYSVYKPLMHDILKKNIKVIVNAGGTYMAASFRF